MASYLDAYDLYLYTFVWVPAKNQMHAVIPFLNDLIMHPPNRIVELSHYELLTNPSNQIVELSQYELFINVMIHRVLHPDTLVFLWRWTLQRVNSLTNNPFLDRLAMYIHYITGLGRTYQIGDMVETALDHKDFCHFARHLYSQLKKFKNWVMRNAAAGVECAVCRQIISISSTTARGYANTHVLPCCFSSVHTECFTKFFLRTFGTTSTASPASDAGVAGLGVSLSTSPGLP